jgi:hypothetical protein
LALSCVRRVPSGLAQRLSTNQGNIARREHNRTQATIRTLKRIAAATGHRLVIDVQK